MKKIDSIPELVYQSNTIAIDSVSIDTSRNVIGVIDSIKVSYVNVSEVANSFAPKLSEDVGILGFIPVLYEYLSIILILTLTIELFLNCSKGVKRIFKTLESDYLTKRYMENTSLALSQLYLRVYLILIISGSFLMFRIMPDDTFGRYAFLNEYRIPIFLASIILIVFLNSVLFNVVRIFMRIKWELVRQVTSLSKAHALFHLIVVLLAIVISYIYPDDDFFISKIVVSLGLTVIIIYTFIVSCKYFYDKNVSFIQYILYFCTVKAVGVLFFGYCIRVIFG